MRRRAKEYAVKMVAHALQMSIEEYKVKHSGELPKSARDVEASLPGFIEERTENISWGIKSEAEYLKNMENPLYSKQTYTISGGGLVDGEPHQTGQVGYIAPSNPSEPFRIIAAYTYNGKLSSLITLVGELPKAESDSGVTKRPQ